MKNLSVRPYVLRVIILGFAVLSVSAMAVTTGNLFGVSIFARVPEIFGIASASEIAPNSDTEKSARVEQKSGPQSPLTVTNGPIIFQRGINAAFDIPYNRGGQLYKIDPATGVETFFTDGSQPNFRLDGSKVVFINNIQLTKIDADGTNLTPLTLLGGGSPIGGLYPKWSPDGSAIAYNSTFLATSGSRYYHTKIIGGNCAACDTTIDHHDFNPTGASSYLHPSWNPHPAAPATAQVVFVRTSAVTADVDNGNFTGDLYTETFTINPDSSITEGQRQPLTNSPAHYAFPVYSHDGTKVAFIKFGSDFASSLIVMNAVLGAPQTVLINYPANGSSAAHHPTWSPDDSFIAFTDTHQIYKVPANAGPVAPVTSAMNSDFDLWPTWAPGSLAPRAVRAVNASGMTGQQVTVPIELDSQGNEAALGFSVNFDPAKLSVLVATLGSGSPVGASLIANTSQTASGHLGILLDLNGATYAAGTRQMITVRFNIAQNAALGTTPISFGNSPVAQSISDLNGASLPATYTGSNVTISAGATPTPTPLPASDLHLRFNSTPPASIKLGESATYNLLVNNEGPAVAHGVYVSGDMPPATLLGLGSSSFCSASGGVFICALGDIDPGPPNATSGTSVRTAVLQLKPARPLSMMISPTVGLDTSRNVDNNTSNNTVTATTTVFPDLELVGIEVTQGVQDIQNSLPLVKGKRTFVRAHIKAASLLTGGVKYKGTLTATDLSNNTVLGTIANSNSGTTVTATQTPQRSILDDSLYFQIPVGTYLGEADWTRDNVQFQINVDGSPLTCSEPDSSPDCKVSVSFKTVNPFSIHFVLATYKDVNGVSHTPTTADILDTVGEIQARYPMYQFDLDYGSTTLAENACNDLNFVSMLAEIKALRTQDIKNGQQVKTFYMGLLADQSACSNSTTNGIGYIGFNGGPNDVGHAAIAFASRSGNYRTDLSASPLMDGNARAHELGHNLGFLHVSSGNGEGSPDPNPIPTDGRLSTSKSQYAAATVYGFDIYGIGNDRIYPAETYDFMTYQRPRWVSASHYSRFFNYIKPASGLPDGMNTPVPRTVSTEKVAVVNGSVSASQNTGNFGSIYVSNSVTTVALADPGEYAVRLEDSAGQILGTYNLSVAPTSSEIPNQPDLTSFSQTIPWNDAARRIILLRNGQILASRQASDNAPVVTVLSPNGGETLSGAADLTWSSGDPDGDTLKYAVDYSTDAGATWQTLASDVGTTSYHVEPLSLAGSIQALFRVTATDGFYSTRDQSDAVFTVPSHGPSVQISVPVGDDQMFIGDQTINLSGTAIDIEDGLIAGTQMHWTSDLNGNLGTGDSLVISASALSEGTHTLTLTATDSTAETGTATRTIRVFRERPTIPMALNAGPGNLEFATNFGTTITEPQAISIRNGGDGDLQWTAVPSDSWIHLDAASGGAPYNLAVAIDPAGLSLGHHGGTVTISSNAATPSVTINVGTEILSIPTSVTGRVLTSDARPIRSATVLMIDSHGTSRRVLTNAFGQFTFLEVLSGNPYRINVFARRYQFESRSFQPAANLDLGDFIGEQ